MKPKDMTNDDLNRRVAELCGAKWMRLLSDDSAIQKRSLVMPEEIESLRAKGLSEADGTEDMCQIHWVPNYAGDLNAMHEAEKALVEVQKRRYGNVLSDIVKPDEYYGEYDTVHATARERAEAFAMMNERK